MKTVLAIVWSKWLHQKVQWIPTFTLFPILYFIGWCVSHFIYIFDKDISPSNLSLIGTIITFLSFITLLPSWAKDRWKTNAPWRSVGLDFEKRYKAIKLFFNGFILATFLLIILILFLSLSGCISNFNQLNINSLFNAFLLILGVGFAEEIIFRGWLMQEMIFLFGVRKGIIFQAGIFSLAHIRLDVGLLPLIPFSLGLFLFGLLLTLRRTIDKGDLWGCMGFHGGLVGVWFLFDSGLVTFSNETPYYLLGAANELSNPISGVVGITMMVILLIFQRRFFLRTGRFLDLTVKASLRDEIP